MNPLNDIVANVHRIRALGKFLDVEGILEADCLECFIPPFRSIDQCRLDWLRDAWIDVVDNGFFCGAADSTWIALLEAVASDELFADWFSNGGCVIEEAGADEGASSWIELSGNVVGIWELNEGMMQADSDRI